MIRYAFALALVGSLFLLPKAHAADTQFCGEEPLPGPASRSLGRASKGSLLLASAFEDSASARRLPLRHAVRCLNWATPRLVAALHRAAEQVATAFPHSPPLGIGDLSRATGGPIPPYSKSHQSGRDADIAFYQLDETGQPVAAEDLVTFDSNGQAANNRVFDAGRTWLLVKALLTDPGISVQWLFISNPLRKQLLDEARRRAEPPSLLSRAEEALHQPTDSRPHADHIHLRIRCSEEERAYGCQS